MFVVVSYDIADDKRRRKIHKALKSYGQWVQFSVFECVLNAREYVRLRDRLASLIRVERDNIRFYHLCEGCEPRIERIGGVLPFEQDAMFVE